MDFEEEIDNYNVPSKLLLTIYQLVAKEMAAGKVDSRELHDKSPVLLSADNLYELLNFLRGSKTYGGVVDNREGLVNNTTFLRNYEEEL